MEFFLLLSSLNENILIIDWNLLSKNFHKNEEYYHTFSYPTNQLKNLFTWWSQNSFLKLWLLL